MRRLASYEGDRWVWDEPISVPPKGCPPDARECPRIDDPGPTGGKTRTFDSGATRDTEEGKIDYEGFVSPAVLRAFGEYMTKHQKQSDGTLRASDNWQKGIPLAAYMKSLWRHFMDVWTWHRGGKPRETVEDAFCGVLFNAMGMFHEYLKEKK